ncbi:MAG: oligosaccharide flippase family protein [Oscillospiraceae bacterium]|nr:oligosaccharide flippase family protein [Oscillospiraceae bacterium]
MLIYTPWMVETIGKSQYGLYTLANSLITLFLVDFGLSSATARYLSKYNAAGDLAGAERFLGAVYKLYAVIDTVILCALTVVFFLLDQIYVNLTPTELEQFKVVYVICALFSVINFPLTTFNGILTAYERFIPLKIADVLYRICNIVFAVIALLLGYGLYALVAVHALVGLLTLAFKFIVIRKTVPLKVDFRSGGNGIYKDIFGFSIWVTVSSLAARLVFTITPSILGIVASSAAIAVFGIVTTIESYAYTITTAINGMFMPRIAKILTNKNAGNDLNRLFVDVGRFQYALNGLIIAGFAVVGKDFIHLWMGVDYTQAYTGILLVLVPGLFFNALQIANTTMVVENKVKVTAMIYLLTGVINVVLSFPLSRQLGVTGACISIAIAYIVRDVLFHIVYHRELSLDIPAFIRVCYVRMSVPILLTVLCGMAINVVISNVDWMSLILKAMMVTVIYLLLVFSCGLSREEKHRVMACIKINRK